MEINEILEMLIIGFCLNIWKKKHLKMWVMKMCSIITSYFIFHHEYNKNHCHTSNSGIRSFTITLLTILDSDWTSVFPLQIRFDRVFWLGYLHFRLALNWPVISRQLLHLTHISWWYFVSMHLKKYILK